MNSSFKLWLGFTLLLSLAFSFIVWILLIHKRKHQDHSAERNSLLLQLENKVISLKFEEREIMMSQISKEVHDNIGQIANMIRMYFYKIEKLAVDQDQLNYIKTAIRFTDDLTKSAHNISYSLNSDFIKKRGLYGIIGDQLEQIQAAGKLEKEIEIEGDKLPIHPEKALIIYRIAQEAFNNIIKHAQATQIKVKLIRNTEFFSLIISDNGIGLCADSFEKGSIGIINMKQRAKLLNGELDFSSTPGSGLTITLTVYDITAV